jgi:TonB family protein
MPARALAACVACLAADAFAAQSHCTLATVTGDRAQAAVFEAIRGSLKYSPQACREGRDGAVVVGFRAVDGQVFRAEVRRSSGDPRFDHEVLAAVARGKSMPDSGEVTIMFKPR